MVKNSKNSNKVQLLRLSASVILLVFLAVIFYPVQRVHALAAWDGLGKPVKLVVVDLTETTMLPGNTYVYRERGITGESGSNALFRDKNPDDIEVEPVFDMPSDIDYGKLEIVNNYLCYTPSLDAQNTTVEVLLKLQWTATTLVSAYRFIFQVGLPEADAESGGLSSLGYQLNDGQVVPISNYQAEIQNYEVALPSNTPVGTEVKLTGTPLNPEATTSIEPEPVELSYETSTQTLMVTTPDGASRNYTVDFTITPPEIRPSITINGTEYKNGDTLLLDFQEMLHINIDTGSGSVKADGFAFWIKTQTDSGCLQPADDEDGNFPQVETQVSGKGTSQILVRFYYRDSSEPAYEDIKLIVSTRADYSSLIAAVEAIPADLSLYTEETVLNLEQLQKAIDYNLDYSAQSTIVSLAAEIQKAISALQYRPADYTRIDQIIEKFNILPDIYTSESMDTVKTIIQNIDRDLNICSQSIIDNCADELQKAIDGLTVRSQDYMVFHDLFRQIPDDLSIYTENSVERLTQAIHTVQEKIASAGDSELDQLSVLLRQAVEGLRLIGSVDFSELEAFIQTLPDSFELYTDQTVQTVLKWKEQASILMQNEDALQEEVDKCLEQLKLAVDSLTLRKADYSVLENVLDQLPDDLSKYTAASVEIVTQLIESIDWDMDITHQQQLDLLAEQLLKLIHQLTLKPEIIPQPEPDETNPVIIPEIVLPEDVSDSSVETVGWKKENGEIVFYRNGKKVTGWQEIEEDRYYFTEDGYMTSGWLLLDTGWYYLNNQGIQQIGWVKLGNAWYYLMPETGLMVSDGLKLVDGEWYSFYDWGGMRNTTWYQVGQDWYFFNGGGHMVKDQWVEWKGKWYYLSSDGKMAFDTITPDGYRVDQDGVWRP